MRTSGLTRLAMQAQAASAALCPCRLSNTGLFSSCRLSAQGIATSSFAARAQQQGQSFSQLKDAAKETTEVVFNPMAEGEEQINAVEQAGMHRQMDESLARVSFHPDSEAAINEQINHEYTMSYVYHQVASYFNRDNVALPGFRTFFQNASLEERSHAQMLMDYQAIRGGRVKLATITAPDSEYNHPEKGDALHAMEIALAMERLNLQYLYNLHEVADKHGDGQFADFVETMLEEQVSGVKEVADYVSKLRRVGKGLGVYQFDAELAAKVAGTANPPEVPTPAA